MWGRQAPIARGSPPVAEMEATCAAENVRKCDMCPNRIAGRGAGPALIIAADVALWERAALEETGGLRAGWRDAGASGNDRRGPAASPQDRRRLRRALADATARRLETGLANQNGNRGRRAPRRVLPGSGRL